MFEVHKVVLVAPVLLVNLVHLVNRDRSAFRAVSDRLDSQDHKVHRDGLGSLETLDSQDNKDLWVLRVREVRSVIPVDLVLGEVLALPVQLALVDRQEVPVKLDRLVHWVNLVCISSWSLLFLSVCVCVDNSRALNVGFSTKYRLG